MKKYLTISYTLRTIAAMAVVGFFCMCNSEQSLHRYYTDNFPVTEDIIANGDTFELGDGMQHVLGAAAVIDEGYIFFDYSSDSLLLFWDRHNGSTTRFAPKGEGPGEVLGVTTPFGQVVDAEGNFTVFDHKRLVLYTTSVDSGFKLKELLVMPESYIKVSPFQALVLKDGTIVSPRADFRYGLVSYNPQTDSVTEWPLGYEFENPDMPDYNTTSLRVTGYAPNRGVVAEIYDNLPAVIMHDESGELISIYEAAPDNAPVVYNDMLLTENHIWLLAKREGTEDPDRVYVLDYDGKPVVEMAIVPTCTFTIDEANRKLIALNPNDDAASVIIYDIPDAVGEL